MVKPQAGARRYSLEPPDAVFKGQSEGPLEGTPNPNTLNITLIYPVYSLIKPLYNPKGPFQGLSFSPLKYRSFAGGAAEEDCTVPG